MADTEFLTVGDAAKYFRVTPRTVHRYISEGFLTGRNTGHWRFTWEEVHACEKALATQAAMQAEANRERVSRRANRRATVTISK